MRHIHRLKPTWILVTGIAGYDHFYRVVLWATCTSCGMEGAFAAEQSTQDADGRLLEMGH